MLPNLDDEVTRVVSGLTYPAYVYTGTASGTELNYSPDGQAPIFAGYSPGKTVYAIMAPDGPAWQRNDEAVWDGRTYIVSGVAVRRDIDGADHHVTITLQIPDSST